MDHRALQLLLLLVLHLHRVSMLHDHILWEVNQLRISPHTQPVYVRIRHQVVAVREIRIRIRMVLVALDLHQHRALLHHAPIVMSVEVMNGSTPMHPS